MPDNNHRVVANSRVEKIKGDVGPRTFFVVFPYTYAFFAHFKINHHRLGTGEAEGRAGILGFFSVFSVLKPYFSLLQMR